MADVVCSIAAWRIFSESGILLVTRGAYFQSPASYWSHVEHILTVRRPIGHVERILRVRHLIGHKWSIFSESGILLVTRGAYSQSPESYWCAQAVPVDRRLRGAIGDAGDRNQHAWGRPPLHDESQVWWPAATPLLPLSTHSHELTQNKHSHHVWNMYIGHRRWSVSSVAGDRVNPRLK
jgi:hypothetical protein